MSKFNSISKILTATLSALLLYLLTTVSDSVYKNIYLALGHKQLSLLMLTILIILLLIILNLRGKLIKLKIDNKSERPFLKIINKCKYPILVEFDNFYWHITRFNKIYKIKQIPWCLNDKVEVNQWRNNVDGFEHQCPVCKNNFKGLDIWMIHKSISSILNSKGLKYFSKDKIIKL